MSSPQPFHDPELAIHEAGSVAAVAAAPVFGELRNALQALLPALEGEAGKEARTNNWAARSPREEAAANISLMLEAGERIREGIDALHMLFIAAPGEHRLLPIVASSARLAHGLTRLVGGLRYPELSPTMTIACPRPVAVATIGAAICAAANVVRGPGYSQGLELQVSEDIEGNVGVDVLGPKLTAAQLEALENTLPRSPLLEPFVAVTARPSGVHLRFRRPARQ